MMADDEIGEFAQGFVFAACRMQLKIPEAYERRRDPTNDRARLRARITVIEHVANHRLTGRDQAERTRGRHTESVHRLATQKFA